MTLPADNVFGQPSYAGFYNLCADSVYYELLHLSPGSHVLQFSGTLAGTTTTAIYNPTVGS